MTKKVRRGKIPSHAALRGREREANLLHVFTWWMLIQILGWAALPLAYRLFRWLPDRGYAFAKPLGLLLTSYTLWIGASLGFLRNTSGGILVALALVTGLCLSVYLRCGKDETPSLLSFLSEHKRLVLTVEILFTLAFCAWALLRAYAADKIMSSGGEKFMEIAFLNAILKSPSFPPLDPWLSGFAISYYYFGYVMMALLTRLSGVTSGIGFELYDALLFALTITGALGVTYNLIRSSNEGKTKESAALQYGLLGSMFVAVMGNLEGLLEALYAKGIMPQAFWRWIDIPDLLGSSVSDSWYPGHGWWWWRASRVIRDRNLLGQPMGISPIDEFPFFSFLLGDNHPHVLALPFVLMSIALALNLLRRQTTRQGEKGRGFVMGGDWALFLAYAVILGALGFLNTWDFPIYLGLTVLAYGIGRYYATGEKVQKILFSIIKLGAGLLISGVIFYLPFYISFQSQAGGILPYLLPPTRLRQYLVMFGPFIFTITWLLAIQLRRYKKQGESPKRFLGLAAQWWGIVMLTPMALISAVLTYTLLSEKGRQFVQGVLTNPNVQQVVGSTSPIAALKAVILARIREPWLFLTLSLLIALAILNIIQASTKSHTRRSFSTSKVFASLLILIGLALTFSVEFIYLRDHFGVRMNTIFKFYYQAWVMLGCVSAYGVWWVLNQSKLSIIPRTTFLAGTGILVAAGMIYPVMASYSRVQGFQRDPNLNGAINIARSHPDDWAAIEWLRANAQDAPIILEAPGKNYDYEGRISAFTGYPTVLGWALHESQWRGNYIEQGKREPDIESIYTTHNGDRALDLLQKWNVEYVIVGAVERRYVQELCRAPERQCHAKEALNKFDLLLEQVFTQGQTTIYQVPETPDA